MLEDDIKRVEELNQEALHPTSPAPGHVTGCPCHRCRTYEEERSERVTIFERYYKVDTIVYREWSYDGKIWCVEWTPYKNPPWTILDLSKIPTCVK